MKQLDLFEKKFAILQELSTAIAITDDIGAIAHLLLDLAINYASAEKGSLMLLRDGDELAILAAVGLDPQFVRGYTVGIGEGIAGTVAKNRSPVLIKNIEKDEGFKGLRRDHYKTKSFISCPIISKNKLLGILNINDKKDGTPFNNDEFELVKTLANQAAIALENTLLLNQVRAKAAELEEINKKLTETDMLKTEFLTRMSHELRTPLNSAKGAIYILQQSDALTHGELKEFQSIIATEIESLISTVENLLKFMRQEDESRMTIKTVLNMRDLFRELQSSKTLKSSLTRKGVDLIITGEDNSALEVVGDKIKVAQLFTYLIDGLTSYLERGDTIRIAADGDGDEQVTVDITLSRCLPEDVKPILEDSRYIFQIERPKNQLKIYLAKNIAEAHRWKLNASNVGALGRITLHIPKSTKEAFDIYVERSMDSFVEFISSLLDLDICSIMLSDELTSELTVRSAVGLDDDVVKKTRIKFGDKIAGWVALEGKPLFIENIENDARFSRKKSIHQYSTKSLMSLPLKTGGRVIGVLNLNNKKTAEPFTDGDYAVASLVSENISHFVERLYAGNFNDEELRGLIGSLGGIFKKGEAHQAKKDLLAKLTDGIVKNSRPLRELGFPCERRV